MMTTRFCQAIVFLTPAFRFKNCKKCVCTYVRVRMGVCTHGCVYAWVCGCGWRKRRDIFRAPKWVWRVGTSVQERVRLCVRVCESVSACKCVSV